MCLRIHGSIRIAYVINHIYLTRAFEAACHEFHISVLPQAVPSNHDNAEITDNRPEVLTSELGASHAENHSFDHGSGYFPLCFL